MSFTGLLKAHCFVGCYLMSVGPLSDRPLEDSLIGLRPSTPHGLDVTLFLAHRLSRGRFRGCCGGSGGGGPCFDDLRCSTLAFPDSGVPLLARFNGVTSRRRPSSSRQHTHRRGRAAKMMYTYNYVLVNVFTRSRTEAVERRDVQSTFVPYRSNVERLPSTVCPQTQSQVLSPPFYHEEFFI